MKSGKQLIKPKIALTFFEKNGGRYQRRPTLTKARKLVNGSLKLKMETCKFIRLRVTYGNFLTNKDKIEEKYNSIDTNSLEDLKGAFEDFTSKSEWLPSAILTINKKQRGGESINERTSTFR